MTGLTKRYLEGRDCSIAVGQIDIETLEHH